MVMGMGMGMEMEMVVLWGEDCDANVLRRTRAFFCTDLPTLKPEDLADMVTLMERLNKVCRRDQKHHHHHHLHLHHRHHPRLPIIPPNTMSDFLSMLNM